LRFRETALNEARKTALRHDALVMLKTNLKREADFFCGLGPDQDLRFEMICPPNAGAALGDVAA
jgi:hypothetical protein